MRDRRSTFERDLLGAAEDQQALHEVLQFADVAGPAVVAQAVARRHREVAVRQAFLIDKMIDVERQQVGHVLAVLSRSGGSRIGSTFRW